MAADIIAAASCGGKSACVFDRAAIFRTAHKHARRELRLAGFWGTYRQPFAIALRAVYYAERLAAEERAYMATFVSWPSSIPRSVCGLISWLPPFTGLKLQGGTL